ncbi:MAG: hypothetical protein GXC76_03655 [Rhodanobacteraceae bacterium]|jgi:hypothetical protein|nr:hypothetical protein [Rhodanobacteraceae bacterium]
MGTMSHRSTYALDMETSQTIKRLAREWQVSQAEVIRRSVRQAAAQPKAEELSPADVINRYRSQPLPRTREETQRLVHALRSQRHQDDAHRVPAPRS